MNNEYNRYYIRIRTILGIAPMTIHEELALATALGPDAPVSAKLQSGPNVSVKEEKMSMMIFDQVVRLPNLQMKILNWYDKLLPMIHIQLMMIL